MAAITKRGEPPTTNTIINDAEHGAGVLPAGQQVQTGGLRPTSTEVLAKHKEEQMNAGHRLEELIEHGALHGAAHVAPHVLKYAGLAVISPLLTVGTAAQVMVEETHGDWKAGQEAKAAHANDVADWALVGALKFDPGFKTEEHEKRPLVRERDGLAIVAQLNASPKNLAALQARADQGFQAAGKAFEAVKGLPADKQQAAMLAALKQSNGPALKDDLAFGKGVEYFMYCQRDSATLGRVTKDVDARAYVPPAVPQRM